ncbi:MAG TPA: tetratricopeptide repeat protein, partial [Blastocatellia bacterium]|nr:tetratricopeptide repeat protein [Blastocatellia bacterium]
MRRVFVAVLTALLAATASEARAQNVPSQGLQVKANEIRAAIDARDFNRAEQLVRTLRSSDPSGFTRNNFDYLLGRLAERRGARAEAQSLYNDVIGRSSVLAPYALWHLATIARASGDLALERQQITRLLAVYPASAQARAARDRMVESLRESKDYRATIALLRPAASTSGVRGRSALARLGEAFAKTGDRDSARAAFNRLISGSRDDYALAASEGLDALDRASGSRPDEFEALRRARIYLFNRHWAEARAHLVDIVERFPASPNRAEALYQTGFTYYREDNFTEAVEWFDRAHREFPDKKDGEQGFYYVGTALQKAQKYDEAARRYMAFIDQYPASDLIEGAYRNVVDSLRYAGRDAEAIEWSRRIMERYAGKPLAAVGLFNEARIELTRGNFDAAFRLLTRLEAYPANPKLVSSAGRGEAAFLKIYAMEKTGRLAEAVRLYLAIPDERDNYYGHRATERLRALAATEAGRRVIAPLARGYREQARAALSAGRYGEAKDAATQALRLASDQATE